MDKSDYIGKHRVKAPKTKCRVCGRVIRRWDWQQPLCEDHEPARCKNCGRVIYHCNGRWYHAETKAAHCITERAEPQKLISFDVETNFLSRSAMIMQLYTPSPHTALLDELVKNYKAKQEPQEVEPLGSEW